MTVVDDRTKEQCKTHRYGVCMTDRVLSGWGAAEHGVSYAVWAHEDGQGAQVRAWVRSRGDAMRVRDVYLDDYKPRGKGHCHIYVVEPGHPALA